MSLTYWLRRWVDPSFASASEKARTELVMEHAEHEHADGDGEVKIFRLSIEPPARRCRVCGRAGRGGSFCMSCLADTMDAPEPRGNPGD